LCGSEIQNGHHQAIYFTIGPYGNFNEKPFCEKLIDKLNFLYYMNVPWMVLYLNLIWLPGPIMCCLAETLKILSERNCNIVGMMTGWSSTKFLFSVADGKSKMASIFQISLPSDPMGIVLKDLFVTGYEANLIFCSV
jgi:hypothetical protein